MSSQGSLFYFSVDLDPSRGFRERVTYPDAPGSKAHGTSEEIAEKIKDSARMLRGKVISALAGRDLTADECAGILNESVLSIRPRFSELVKQGKIIDSGIRRKNESGHNATVWRIAA